MKRHILIFSAAACLTSAGFAQSAQTGSHNPAIKDGKPHTINAAAKGANSFTEDQARGRFEKAGYTGIGKLTKANGLWYTTAMKGGKKATVMLDYKGNITTK
ncbi:hypothetical protein C1T17_14995 [Sphingobium sp. SCG-1]|uniref:hypothetical protein n=1 Tax=Sphingobium sp. SCG-1 TaxID=2072936 RepID=UPI000CD67A09|nr:hypothetical protein [Sphingobium sp. SCG-1]AUW59200.1 hypothetical protein C1T17_14995 [Sphingobium sp. SCG-1]